MGLLRRVGYGADRAERDRFRKRPAVIRRNSSDQGSLALKPASYDFGLGRSSRLPAQGGSPREGLHPDLIKFHLRLG